MVKIIFFDFFSARNVVKIEKSVKLNTKLFVSALKSKNIYAKNKKLFVYLKEILQKKVGPSVGLPLSDL